MMPCRAPHHRSESAAILQHMMEDPWSQDKCSVTLFAAKSTLSISNPSFFDCFIIAANMEKEIFAAMEAAHPQKDPLQVMLLTQDEYQLGRLGYKQEFYRHLGLFESWAATFTSMSKCIQPATK